MGMPSRGCDKSALVVQEEKEITVSKWLPMPSSVRILGACLFVPIVCLLIFSVHSNLCLQRSIGELQQDIDLHKEELNRLKSDSEEMQQLLRTILEHDENHFYDEEGVEEDEEERDTYNDEFNFDIIVDENSSRRKRDLSDNSSTVKPPRERSDKRKKKNDRDRSRRGDRGKERIRHGRKEYFRKGTPKAPLRAIHFEGYVKDKHWKQAADGQIHEIPYLHGTLSQHGFLPLNHTYQFWSLPDWCKHGVRFASYDGSTGHLIIKEAGVYYIYSQVMYHDLTGSYVYGIYVNGELQFQCMTTRRVDARDREMGARHAIYEQCYTGGVVYLHAGQRVSIRDVYLSLRPKTLLNLDHSTFWGIIKLDG